MGDRLKLPILKTMGLGLKELGLREEVFGWVAIRWVPLQKAFIRLIWGR